MPIRVQCAGCKTTLAVKDHLAGKRVKCPKCQSPLSVPGESTATGPMPVNKPAAKKTPVAKPADLEALAAAALGDDPAPTNGASGNGSSPSGDNGHAPAADAPIKFNCEYCDASIEMPYDEGGKRAQCPECRQIIKVPMPKIEKPKDWRTVEKKGPSLAAMNQPAKIENAWGTENKSKVSQTALLEAGVIAKPKKPSIGLAAWIERGVKGGLVALVLGGVALGVWKLRQGSIERNDLVKYANFCDPKWPAVIQAEYYVGLAEMALRQPKQRDVAREHYITAWQKVAAADKIDRDFFLIELAKAQLSLGGDEMDIRGQDRFDWKQEVFGDVERTVNMIDDPDAKVTAVRELTTAFVDKKQPGLGIDLASKIASNTPKVKAFQLALLVADGTKSADANRIAQKPEAKGPIAMVARCGYAEAFARKGELDNAKETALRPGDMPHKFEALIAIAASLSLDANAEKAKQAKEVCEVATKLLEKDAKPNIPGWVLLQHVRLVARFNVEEAKGLSQKLPAAYRRRGQIEVVLAQLASNPPPANAVALIGELDKDGRGLAWLAMARSHARANLDFQFVAENPEDVCLGPFLRASKVFGVRKNH